MAAANNDAFFCRVKSAPSDIAYISKASKPPSAAEKARCEARRKAEDIIEARNNSFKEVWEE